MFCGYRFMSMFCRGECCGQCLTAPGTIRQLAARDKKEFCHLSEMVQSQNCAINLKFDGWSDDHVFLLLVSYEDKAEIGVYGWTQCRQSWWLRLTNQRNCIGVPEGLVGDQFVCLCMFDIRLNSGLCATNTCHNYIRLSDSGSGNISIWYPGSSKWMCMPWWSRTGGTLLWVRITFATEYTGWFWLRVP